MSDLSIMVFPWGAESPSMDETVELVKLAEDLGFLLGHAADAHDDVAVVAL
jgi:hypothetical protein